MSGNQLINPICLLQFSYAMNGYKAGDQLFVKSSWWNVTLLSITYTLVVLAALALVLYILYYILKLSHKYGLKRIKKSLSLRVQFFMLFNILLVDKIFMTYTFPLCNYYLRHNNVIKYD